MALVYWLLDPFTWITVVFGVWIWAVFKTRKRLAKVSGSLLTLFVIVMIVSPEPVMLLKQKERIYIPLDASKLDTTRQYHIMALGAGKVSDPMLPPSTQLGGTVLARLVEGIRIYRQLPGARLISSASAGDSKTTQAKTVAGAAVELGVSSLDTLQLPGGYNTESEARAYVERFGVETPLILVTSAVHMERAVFWFEYYGVEVIPAPCDYRIKEDPDDPENWWWPSFGKLELLGIWLHEKLGLWWGKLKTK